MVIYFPNLFCKDNEYFTQYRIVAYEKCIKSYKMCNFWDFPYFLIIANNIKVGVNYGHKVANISISGYCCGCEVLIVILQK